MSIMYRTRRLRKTENIRRLVRETKLSVDDLIYPLFIEEGKGIKAEIPSMPGIFRMSLDNISAELDEVTDLKIPAVILFGIPSKKDAVGTETWNDDGIIQRAIRFIKTHYPDLYVITDVCFCEYTDHGHCGVICDNDVDNDKTLQNLEKQVISHAKAGADMVAPSGMMDGTIQTIRKALDENDLMPRELALTKIWRDDNYFTSRSMDVYIAKLRKYLKVDENVEILNIHGEGFRLVVNQKA